MSGGEVWRLGTPRKRGRVLRLSLFSISSGGKKTAILEIRPRHRAGVSSNVKRIRTPTQSRGTRPRKACG